MPKKLKLQSDDEVSSSSASASSSERETPTPEQLIQNIYDKVCGNFKTNQSPNKPVERILNSSRRNKTQKFNKLRHEMFSVQGAICYTDHSDLRYASNDVGALTSCLGDISEFRTFYNNDLSLVSGNRSITLKQTENLKNIFTYQSSNTGQLILYKKSSNPDNFPRNRFNSFKHRGVASSNLKVVEELNKLLDQQSTAMLCLIRIKSKDAFVSLVKSILKNVKDESKKPYYEYLKAVEELCYITHIADAHIGRVPGMDKYFRALLRQVSVGEATFENLFSPSNGTYFLGRSGGTHFSGYIGTLLSDKNLRSNSAYQQLENAIDENAIEEYMSDSSDEETDEEKTRVTSKPAPRRDRDETDSIGSLPDKLEKHHISKGR